MNKAVVGLIAGLAVGAGATWFALHGGGAAPAKVEAPAGKPKEKPNPLQLNAAKRTAAGITLAKPSSAALPPEVTAFGRVLDLAAFVALAGELEVARTSLVASEKAAGRIRELFSAGANASAQSVEAAEAAAARDRVAVASARARLVAGWGRKLADTDLKTVASGLENGAALVRIDVLSGDAPAAELKKASVGLFGGGEMMDVEILGVAPSADPQLQGVSLLGLVARHTLPVGAALRVTLTGAGDAAAVLVVPRSGVVYHQGSAWVFVLGEEDTFERKVVTLGRSVGDTVAIASGLEDRDLIVTAGAGQLLSAELQAGGAPEEK